MHVGRGVTRPHLPPVPAVVAIHLAGTAATMGLRVEHFAGNALLLGLWAGGGRARRLATLMFPFWVTAVVYDAFRFLEPLRAPVRVAGPYLVERAWFGVGTPAEVPAIAWQAAPAPGLDLVCGLAYILYLLQPLALAAYLFVRGHHGRVRWLAWSFLAVNVAGLVTHLLYPVAPPWYVARYGLEYVGPVPPEAAGAARFDALTGTGWFAAWYARSPDVFGALPSLHAAYPVLCLGATWGLGARWRVGGAAFALLVGAAAVYLGHHYVIDVLAGWAYAAVALAGVAALVRAPAFHARPGHFGEDAARGRPAEGESA